MTKSFIGAGLLAGAALSAFAAAGPAWAVGTTATLSDGTVVAVEIDPFTRRTRANYTGGAFADTPTTLDYVTTYSSDYSTMTLEGTVTRGGTSSPFSCVVSVSESRVVSGSDFCSPLYGQPYGGSTKTTTVVSPTPASSTPVTVTTVEITPATAAEAREIERQMVGLVQAAVDGALNRAVLGTVDGMVTDRLRDLTSILSGRMRMTGNGNLYSGLAAGNGDMPWEAWVSFSGAAVETAVNGRAEDGWAASSLAGIDWTSGPVTLGGVVGYAWSELDVAGLGGTHSSGGMIAGPYAAFRFAQSMTLGANLLYSGSGADFDRTSGGTRVTSAYDQQRVSGSVFLSGGITWGQALLEPSLGFTHAWIHTDSYRDSSGLLFPADTDHLSQVDGMLRLTWRGWQTVQPLVQVGFEHDLSASAPDDDRTALLLGTGMALRFGDRLSGRLLLTSQQLKDDERNDGVTGSLHYRF